MAKNKAPWEKVQQAVYKRHWIIYPNKEEGVKVWDTHCGLKNIPDSAIFGWGYNTNEPGCPTCREYAHTQDGYKHID
jgi:hypothetical protein